MAGDYRRVVELSKMAEGLIDSAFESDNADGSMFRPLIQAVAALVVMQQAALSLRLTEIGDREEGAP